MKKVIKFLALMLLVAIVAFGISIYIARHRGTPSSENILDRFEQVTEHYPLETSPVKLTSDEGSFAFFPQGSTKLRYYHPRSGEIKEIELLKPSTPKVLASLKPLASAISWSPNGNVLLVTYPDGTIVIDLSANTSKPLDKKIIQPVFSRQGSQVAYVFFNDADGVGNISVADAKFENFKNLLKTRLKNWEIQWNDQRRLSLIATSSTTKLNSLYLLDTQDKSFVQLMENKEDLKTRWSPDGSSLIFSRKFRNTNHLYLFSLSETTISDLKLTGTADVCTWSANNVTIYCATSESGTEDVFYKISLETLKIETLVDATTAGLVDARELLYIDSIPALVYKNFKDGRLYMLRLSK